jgi:hypothetical protein
MTSWVLDWSTRRNAKKNAHCSIVRNFFPIGKAVVCQSSPTFHQRRCYISQMDASVTAGNTLHNQDPGQLDISLLTPGNQGCSRYHGGRRSDSSSTLKTFGRPPLTICNHLPTWINKGNKSQLYAEAMCLYLHHMGLFRLGYPRLIAETRNGPPFISIFRSKRVQLASRFGPNHQSEDHH